MTHAATAARRPLGHARLTLSNPTLIISQVAANKTNKTNTATNNSYMVYTEFRLVIPAAVSLSSPRCHLCVSPAMFTPCTSTEQSCALPRWFCEAIRATYGGGANVPAVARDAQSLRMSVQLQARISADAVSQPVTGKIE